MLRAGIVGLPNIGKTTLFNAVTAQTSGVTANYAFSTSKPNVGVVTVPDERLGPLAKIVKTSVIVPATVEFVDIAGLVRGSSKGEGMGNQFVASIRETDTMIHVVRCFEDENIVHVDDTVDARRDIETIQIELALADLATVERRRERVQKGVKGGEKNAKTELEVLDKLHPALEEFLPAKSVSLTEEARAWTIPQGSRAQDAAGAIHSDIARGFIRAEIVSYDALLRAGSYAAAKEQGLTRLEGKDYIMQEGDVVNFRFNV